MVSGFSYPVQCWVDVRCVGEAYCDTTSRFEADDSCSCIALESPHTQLILVSSAFPQSVRLDGQKVQRRRAIEIDRTDTWRFRGSHVNVQDRQNKFGNVLRDLGPCGVRGPKADGTLTEQDRHQTGLF